MVLRAEQFVVEFADALQGGLEFAVIAQPLLDQGLLFGGEADLPGAPPRWTWPRMVTRASWPSCSSSTFLTHSTVIGSPSRLCAPSVTSTKLCRRPIACPARIAAH